MRLPVSLSTAFSVMTDLNTIMRLSPFFTLKHIEPPPGGTVRKGDRYRLSIEYYATKITETHAVEIERLERDRLISYRIDNSILRNIVYEIQPAGAGVQLTQTFELDSADQNLLKGSQDELRVWLNSVSAYMKLAEGDSFRKRIQKFVMDRLWLRLSISERTIAMIMMKISILELVLLLLLVLVWNIWLSR